MKIAMFIYERGLQVHHYNFVKGFVDRSDEVYLFIHDADEFVFRLQNFKVINVRLFNIFDSKSLISKFERKYFKIIFSLYTLLKIDLNNLLISKKTLKKSAKIIRNIGQIDLAVGFEKKGLIWAGKLFENTKTKLFYYSLELYEDGHYSYINDSSFPLIREEEKLYHQKCDATIIQDAERCDFLYRINNIRDQKALFLPVSVSKEIPVLIPGFIVNKVNRRDVKIILYFGRIDDHRKSFNIAEGFSQRDSKNFILVLNGEANYEYISKILRLSANIFHFDKSPEEFIDSILNDAYIGLVPYDYKSANDELTVFASEKLAYYLKHGKPIIAFSNSQYEKFFKEYKCGLAIKNSNELWNAILTIEADYSSFQRAAYMAFEKFYCFENRFDSLYNEIESIMLDRC